MSIYIGDDSPERDPGEFARRASMDLTDWMIDADLSPRARFLAHMLQMVPDADLEQLRRLSGLKSTRSLPRYIKELEDAGAFKLPTLRPFTKDSSIRQFREEPIRLR